MEAGGGRTRPVGARAGSALARGGATLAAAAGNRHARGAARTLLAALLAAVPLPVRAEHAPEPVPVVLPARPDTPVSEALVLGGGGSRGLAHAGVLVGLERLGRPPGLVVGTSMGAIIGSLYAAGYDAAQVREIVERSEWLSAFGYPAVAVPPGPPPVRPLLRVGFGGAGMRPQGLAADQGINRLLVRYLFDAGVRARGDFDRLPRRFRAVATDLGTGAEVVLAAGDLPRTVRASMAVPAVFPPVVMNGRVLVDGGVADNLPVDVARALGARTVIASDVVRPDTGVRARDPIRLGLRGLRLLIQNAAPDVRPDILIRPRIPLLMPSSFFPRNPEFLVHAGLQATLAALPPRPTADSAAGSPSFAPGGGPALPSGPPPDSLTSLRIEAVGGGMADLAAEAFRGAAPARYSAVTVLRDVDRLYATGLVDAVWPRVEGGDTLVVRVEPRPPVSLSLAGGYEADRGLRGWGAARAWLGRGEVELLASADGLRRELLAGARLHAVVGLPVTAGAGGLLRARTIRGFTESRLAGREEVRRAGGWLGGEVRLPHPVFALSAELRAEHISSVAEAQPIPGAVLPIGNAVGGVVRLEDLREAPIVGVPLGTVLETWGGGVAYRVARAQISAPASLGRWRGALVLIGAAASHGAPPDADPALGDSRALPGLRWGEDRARTVVVAGGDIAYPIPLAGFVRLRLRAARAAGAVPGFAVSEAWRGGAELAGIWDTPAGRLEAGFGASPGRSRLFLDLGRAF